MVQKIHIKNFKSVYDLELDLGRFNVFIGENGCGKSNILEAVAMGSAASANLLANEFLASRGIRVTEPNLMFSAFKKNKESYLSFEIDNNLFRYNIVFNSEKKWFEDLSRNGLLNKISKVLVDVLNEENTPDKLSSVNQIKLSDLYKTVPENEKISFKEEIQDYAEKAVEEKFFHMVLSGYLIFTPENNSLRNFFDEKQIAPFGLNGAGLFKELKRISYKKSKKQFTEINRYLAELLDWFDKFELSKNGFPGEQFLKIKDKFLPKSVNFIDQRSANEGFLFLLFFLTLFISEDTPTFFAIDNIENSFNPKLCSKLVQILVMLSKEHSKQALITTHSPFILDGLDLNDDEQRLFVVRRNLKGHTIVTRIKPDKPLSYRLSEAWMNGYIGGLPNNF